jgi:hypothetical protein
MTPSYQSAWPEEPCGRDALIEGPYRYLLRRWWGPRQEYLLWIMLNPSTADGQSDDATLLRCLAFSRREGYDRLMVANLFAYRSPRPAVLRRAADPVGPDNDLHLQQALVGASQIVLGWGALGSLYGRDRAVLALLRQTNRPIFCLAVTAQGAPRHPLYLSKDAPLLPYPCTFSWKAQPGSLRDEFIF